MRFGSARAAFKSGALTCIAGALASGGVVCFTVLQSRTGIIRVNPHRLQLFTK